MKIVKSFFDHLCRVYTISAMLFLLLNLAIAGTLENTHINAQAFLLVFLFAVGFAAANMIYTSSFATGGVRLTIHFVLTTLSAFLFLCLPSNPSGGNSGKIVILLVMILLYWIFMSIYLALSRAKKKSEPAKTEYQSVFKK